MRPMLLLFVLSVAFASAAIAAGPGVKDEMKAVVEPAANTVFAVGGDVDPANGPDAAKVPDARWQEALKAAQALKSVAVDLNDAHKKRRPRKRTAQASQGPPTASATPARLAIRSTSRSRATDLD
jgi:hypothetical protein